MVSTIRLIVALTVLFASSCADSVARVREVATFPLGSWGENLAVRSDGNLLFTRLDTPDVFAVNHLTGDYKPLASLANAMSALGIAEVEPDVFAVAAGNYSLTTGESTVGSFSIWSVDLRYGVKTSKVADVPAAASLNGVARLDSHSILAVDSLGGVVYRVDTHTGAVASALSGVEYEAPPPPALQLGVNGIKVHSSTLYFTNTGARTFSRVLIHPDGTAAGEVEVISGDLGEPDDFALSPRGGAFVTLHQMLSVDLIDARGGATHVAGGSNSTNFAVPTAAQLGRAPGDEQTLYVTTSGLRDASLNPLGPAEILAVNVSQF